MPHKRDRLRKSALREKPGWGAKRGASERRYQAMPGDVQRLKLLAGPHPAMFSHKRNLYGTAWLSCMSETSSPRDELSSTGRNPCHSRFGPAGTAGPPSNPARGRSRVSTAASGRGQLRLNGVIDVSVDIVVTDAPEDAVTR